MFEKIKKFRRFEEGSWIGGVCVGVAYQTKTPTWLVRAIIVIIIAISSNFDNIDFLHPIIAFLYITLWIFAPKNKVLPTDFEEISNS
ncbi:MAG: PspC domain-containing protein [Candidatus Nomurabacteria bacterium]